MTAIDEAPMFVNMPLAMTAFSNYPGNAQDRAVFAVIAEYANRQGVAYPTMRRIADRIDKTAMDVCRSVHRLAAKGFLTVKKALKGQDKHPRNVYTISRRFLRKTADVRSRHYIAEKWKAKAQDVAKTVKKNVVKAVETLKEKAVSLAENWDNVVAPAVQAPAVQAPAVQAPAVQAPAVQAPAVAPACYQREKPAVTYATWRDRVAAYQKAKEAENAA